MNDAQTCHTISDKYHKTILETIKYMLPQKRVGKKKKKKGKAIKIT